ncbi:VOC family protein [Kaistia granuli]|uniref:VOC family protein n=1 Tax=Kaistia granuli TaxID=363259 RepID=UPI00035E4853|nr:VOC family protein [Kaistia granuli]
MRQESTEHRYLAALALVVRDYDEAIAWYRDRLGFVCVEDTPLEAGKRWVLMAPNRSAETRILLAEARGDVQRQAIGHQSGGRVFLFLHTDDFKRDYAAFQARGVTFLEAPRQERYGLVAVFEDLYGNKWDLLQPTA